MKNDLISENKKIPGLSYAVMANGIELPVLDITHPLFIKSIDEKKLSDYLKEAETKGEKRAGGFSKIPGFIKRFLMKRSFIMADFMSEKKEDNFLSGLSTLLLKMGPDLIAGGRKRFFDRLISKGIGGIVLRMRLRDISRLQSGLLIPLLKNSPGKDICFINIGGGPSCDSINTLFLILEEDRELLNGRNIEINVLDIDPAGPDIAERFIKELKSFGGKFREIEITLNYIPYNWENQNDLKNLLLIRKNWINICASEGGLFEYGDDETILRNLNAISDNSTTSTILAGSVLRDIDTVDPATRAGMKITGIRFRLLGIKGIERIIERTNWKLHQVVETNPRYLVFSLRMS